MKTKREPRFYIHQKGLFWDYRRNEEDFNNKYFEHAPWHIKEYWNVGIRFSPKLWDSWDFYYDGHTVRSWTILGLEFSYGYSYDSRPVKDWEADS